MEQKYLYQDIQEFQKRHPEKEERARILRALPDEEIYHLARTCGNVTTAACFMQFVKQARNVEENDGEET